MHCTRLFVQIGLAMVCNTIERWVFFYSDAAMNLAFEDRLAQILDAWIFEASIAFGVGNLRRLKLPVAIFEKDPHLSKDGQQPEKNLNIEIRKTLILSLNYTMNGKMIKVLLKAVLILSPLNQVTLKYPTYFSVI